MRKTTNAICWVVISFTLASGQGIYAGGADDGYDSITLEWSSAPRVRECEKADLPTVWKAGERVAYRLLDAAQLIDAAGKTVAVFRPGPDFELPSELPEGVYFFVYMGEGRRILLFNGREN